MVKTKKVRLYDELGTARFTKVTPSIAELRKKKKVERQNKKRGRK